MESKDHKGVKTAKQIRHRIRELKKQLNVCYYICKNPKIPISYKGSYAANIVKLPQAILALEWVLEKKDIIFEYKPKSKIKPKK